MSTQTITVLASVSSALGFLTLLAYFYLVVQFRRAERSVRETVEGEGLFNSGQVLEILKQFSDDQARLKALAHLTSLDQNKANAILQKIKSGVDVSQLQRLTYRHYISWAGLVGGVLLLLGLLGIFVPRENQSLDSPTTVSPNGGALFTHFPRTLALTWEPVSGSRSYVVQVEIQDPSSTTWHPHPFGLGQRIVNDTQLTFEFVGSQPGRWRVAAVSKEGNYGRFSNWAYFEFRDKKSEVMEESREAQLPEPSPTPPVKAQPKVHEDVMASPGQHEESPSPSTQEEDRKISPRSATPTVSTPTTLVQVTDLTGNSFVLEEPEVAYPSGFGPSREKGIRVRRGATEAFLEWARMRSLAFASRKEKNAKGKDVWQYDVTIELADGTKTVVSLIDDWNMAYMGGGGPGLLFGKTELGDSSVKFSEIREMKILQATNAPAN